jgi:hypothetical protein
VVGEDDLPGFKDRDFRSQLSASPWLLTFAMDGRKADAKVAPVSEAYSFQIATDDQAETDRLWPAILATAALSANVAGARTAGACRG